MFQCRMIGRLLAAPMLFLASAGACAQVFYTIESPDGSVDWLLGTLHSEDPRVLEFPPVLEQALAQAEVVALELVPGPAMLERLDEAMRLPDGVVLADRLPPALYRRTLDALLAHGVDRELAVRMRPWAAAMTLGQPPMETGRFMDLAVASTASAAGARVVGLERLDEQLRFFSGLDRQTHVRLLEIALAELDRGADAFEPLIDAYLDGDLARLARQAEAQLAGLPEAARQRFRREALARRNQRMAARARPLLEASDTLIAIGSLHLPGVIALLEARGFTVTPVY